MKGCPYTQMTDWKHEFENQAVGLDLSMKPDSPHYNSSATRIAYFKFESEQIRED